MTLGEKAFGRVCTLDYYSGEPYVGYVYHTLGIQTTYILRLNMNLDYYVVTTLGGVSSQADI